ncbi:DinB family protein [Tessaracoccus sp. MC1865]|nr:DinB family protein [Tessaracoccus sp. MC1865]MBB1484308.1 DinB family protein [Tessaracoccus sp. MC1865]
MVVPDEVLARLEDCREEFRGLVREANPADLVAPTRGTRWTNRELLFHMWFGQHLARVFVPLFGVFGRLPRPVSAGYARGLTALSRPYNWINYAGPVAGVRIVSRGRLERWMDADTRWLLTWAGGASDAELRLGMPVPESWDPYFASWMTRLDVLDWAPKHYRHHRAQLTLSL